MDNFQNVYLYNIVSFCDNNYDILFLKLTENPTCRQIFYFRTLLVSQSCSSLCNPIDCRLPGPSAHGIYQERRLEWVVIPFSRHLPDTGIELGSPALQADSVPSESKGMPQNFEHSNLNTKLQVRPIQLKSISFILQKSIANILKRESDAISEHCIY